MKTIVHTCSSVLVRPNGIVRYINSVIDLQRAHGHRVIFVCDSRPTQCINADQTVWLQQNSTYVPNIRDNHVWLQVDVALVLQIQEVFSQLTITPDLVVSHDLHSFLAAQALFNDGIFVQHESDVLTPCSRWSFLSDEYLNTQLTEIHSTNWRIGLTVHSQNINPKNPVYTPVPFSAEVDSGSNRPLGLLYVGDTTERKGAREFMTLAKDLSVRPTVITHEPDRWLFFGADVYQFALAEKNKMYALMRQHRVAFISSKNECPGIAALECLQFMPTVVDSQYRWTEYLRPMGATLSTGVDLQNKVSNFLNKQYVSGAPELVEWSKMAQTCWINLSQ